MLVRCEIKASREAAFTSELDSCNDQVVNERNAPKFSNRKSAGMYASFGLTMVIP